MTKGCPASRRHSRHAMMDGDTAVRRSHRSHRGVAQPGRAPRLGRGGRRFKSCLPDHQLPRYQLPRSDAACSAGAAPAQAAHGRQRRAGAPAWATSALGAHPAQALGTAGVLGGRIDGINGPPKSWVDQNRCSSSSVMLGGISSPLCMVMNSRCGSWPAAIARLGLCWRYRLFALSIARFGTIRMCTLYDLSYDLPAPVYTNGGEHPAAGRSPGAPATPSACRSSGRWGGRSRR